MAPSPFPDISRNSLVCGNIISSCPCMRIWFSQTFLHFVRRWPDWVWPQCLLPYGFSYGKWVLGVRIVSFLARDRISPEQFQHPSLSPSCACKVIYGSQWAVPQNHEPKQGGFPYIAFVRCFIEARRKRTNPEALVLELFWVENRNPAATLDC